MIQHGEEGITDGKEAKLTAEKNWMAQHE